MEPLSKVHRTRTDFDTQASKETGKGPMEPLMEMTDWTCKNMQKKKAFKQASARWSHSQRSTARSPIFTCRQAKKRQWTDGVTDEDDSFDIKT